MKATRRSGLRRVDGEICRQCGQLRHNVSHVTDEEALAYPDDYRDYLLTSVTDRHTFMPTGRYDPRYTETAEARP